MRMCVRSVRPSSNRTRQCLPTASDPSTIVPASNGANTSRGASNRTSSLPASARSSAAAVRWMVSPSGTSYMPVTPSIDSRRMSA